MPAPQFVYHDGGRKEAGYVGRTRDCVVRSIAIALELPYVKVYDDLNELAKQGRKGSRQRNSNSRTGVHRVAYEKYLKANGWIFIATMKVGTGCTTHLNADELPKGRIIARLAKHLCAVIDGVVYDNVDPSNGGKACVYGFYMKDEK